MKDGILLKFTEEEYVEDLAKGNVFFQSIKRYKDLEMLENECEQGDLFESAIRWNFNGTEIRTVTKESNRIFIACFTLLEFGNELKYNMKGKCYYIDSNVLNGLQNLAKDRCAVLFDLKSVIRQIKKIRGNGKEECAIQYGKIKYIENSDNIKETGLRIDLYRAFRKDKNYEHQKEWRIAGVVKDDQAEPFVEQMGMQGVVVNDVEQLGRLAIRRKLLEYNLFFKL